MRKNVVLKSEPCEPPIHKEILVREVYRDRRMSTTIAKAQIVEGDSSGRPVLNVDFFSEGTLSARWFADKEAVSRMTYIPKTGYWGELSIQNTANAAARRRTNYSMYALYCEREDWAWDTTDDEEIAMAYLGNTVEYWDYDYASEKYRRKLERKDERIQKLMTDLTPEIPGDFPLWVENDVFDRRYIFQSKTEKRVKHTCTGCGQTWYMKKAMGIGTKICPKCGDAAIGTWKKEEKSAEKNVYLMQPSRKPGIWVQRVFKAQCYWKPDKLPLILYREQIRAFIRDGESAGALYYYDGDIGNKPTFSDRNHMNVRMGRGLLYPGTLGEIAPRWPEKVQHMGLEILAAKKIEFNVNNTIYHSRGISDSFEYLVKGGFYRLAIEVAEGWWNDAGDPQLTGIRKGARNTQEALALDNGRIQRLKNMGGGMTVLEWLRYEKRFGKISQKNLIKADKHGIRPSYADVWNILSKVESPERFINYVEKQAQMEKTTWKNIIDEWSDYLDMARKQELNLSADIFVRPKSLKAAHDECVRFGEREQLKKKAALILEKFPDVEKIMDGIREKYDYSGEKFCIRTPVDVIDIIHEGRALGHCIDTTDRYFDRIQNHVTYLLFLRRASDPDLPYYTLEVEPGGTIRQQRTTGNNQNKEDVKEYMPFIKEWQKVVRERINSEDMRLAEESRLTRIREYKELRDKKETVWRGALAGKLLVDVLEADLIEAI